MTHPTSCYQALMMVVNTVALSNVMIITLAHLTSKLQIAAFILKVRNQLNLAIYGYLYIYACTVSPMVEWDLPKAVGLHGAPIKGSCSVTAYPKPAAVTVITPFGCYSRHNNIHIGKHTIKAEFIIKNVTKECEEIHCFIHTFATLNTTELLIIGKYQCRAS